MDVAEPEELEGEQASEPGDEEEEEPAEYKAEDLGLHLGCLALRLKWHSQSNLQIGTGLPILNSDLHWLTLCILFLYVFYGF